MHEPRILGHSVHPVIIVSPLCLLSLAVVFDFIHLLGGASYFAVVSYWMMATGLIGGMLTSLLSWVDWMTVPGPPRAKAIGLAYGLVNLAVLLLYTGSWYSRYNDSGMPELVATVFSTLGAGVALLGLLLGGELLEPSPARPAAGREEIISLNVTTTNAHGAIARGAH